MRIGADYYPEHWEKERWKTDFELMNQAHIKVVRIGEFTWSLYEPVEGKFDFSWMDEALDALHEYGIKVVLCTPSATPPKWMIDRYPDILQRDIYGRAKLSGTRKHYCFNSSVYRKKCHILNTKIAERYGHHPAVEAWQVDNELGWSNTTRCYCDECQDKFRFWLKQKYKTIDRLNEKYGTVVWSQIYNGFDEVNIPRAGACYESCHDTQGQNPGLLLDYYRFCSDSVVDFTKETCEDIRAYSSYPISTNMLDAAVNSGTGINYFDLSEKLDFATWDNYIEFQWGVAEDATVSRDHALIRSYKKKPFWVMEQQAGACGWSKMGPTPTPGKLRLWTYSAVANGADTVVYFRWRTALFGLEQYWHGILNHDGKPGRRYEEISQIGREMELLNQTVGTLMPKARVAIIKSFDSEWSHSIHRHVENFQYDNYELSFYRAFYRLGIAVDFISEKEDMSGYDLVFAPALIMADTETVESLSAYVKNGGSLLLTFRSGIKDEFNAMLPETVPGVFAELAGIQVNDYDPQMEKQTTSSGVFGEAKSTLWCDIIEETTARPLGVYTSDFYAGKSCMTVNEYGNGEVYYLGCDLDDDAMLRLAEYLGDQVGLELPLYEQKGVETVDAGDGKQDVRFIMNHNAYPVTIAIKEEKYDLIAQKKVDRTIELEPYGVAIVK